MHISSLSRIALIGALVAWALAAPPTGPAAAGGCGTTVKETLSGPAIGGVVPEGEARADESRFLCGGDTILTVQVKKVNLPDGTVLGVTLDFQSIGTITLSRGEGTMSVNLGHFAVRNDEVAVYNGATQILIGAYFR